MHGISDRLLVFVHGFMGHPSDWDEVRAMLDDFESESIELKPAANWHQSRQQLAEEVPSEAIVVGYSMGARLALGLAIEEPEKCRGLVFVSGNPGLRSDADRTERWQHDQNVARNLQSAIETEDVESFLEDWYQQGVFSSVAKTIREAEIKRKLNRSQTDWPQMLLANSVARQPDYWERLGELAIPALVVAGENDEKYRRFAVEIGKSVRGIKSVIVPDCGHIVHREQPVFLSTVIREFIGELR